MGLEVLALLCLIGAIVIGFVRKSNVGLVCLGLSLILGTIGGLSAKEIYAGFPGKLFATLLGTMLFFSLLQNNGTLEALSRRMTAVCGKMTFLVPISIYIISFVLSAAGPGAISVQTVMVLLAVPLGIHMGVSPLLMGVMAILGAVGGTASPIALTGILVGDLLNEMSITGYGMPIFIGVSIANLACAVVSYIVLKGWKKTDIQPKAEGNAVGTEKFTQAQLISIALMLVMVVAVIGFSQDVGLVCFTLSLVLMLLRCGDEKKAVKALPWNTLMLIAGVNVLMNITKTMGGIDLLASILASFMNRTTAAPLMGLTGGIMSWFSSANGVVFPTLIPTVPDVASQVGGASVLQMVVAIVCSATVAGISPMSTGGSLVMASYAQETGADEKQQSKLFARLFMISGLCVGLVFLLTLVGLLSFLH